MDVNLKVKGFELLVKKDDQRLKYLDPRGFEWEEITEDEYHNFLDMLPPIFQTRYGFMLSERYTDNVTKCFVKYMSRYFTAYVDFTGIKDIGAENFYESLIESDEFQKAVSC